jgi:hypothetical protein
LVVRSEALETERLAWHVLSAELAAGIPSRDWWVEGAGRVLPLRAFRGLAEVCPSLPADAGGAWVRYGGIRLADPAKDSLLVLTRAGAWVTTKLANRSPSTAGCPGWSDEPLERWSWEPGVTGALLLRAFERGSYHLEDRALRYRLGGAGRQPLTVERIESSSAFVPSLAGLDLLLSVLVEEDVVWSTRRRISAVTP